MVEMLSPGVYVTETDFSQFVKSISTSTFGIVGVFEKGPMNAPTLVTSLEEAKALFGGYLDSLAGGHYGMFALKAFFENGGARAYVVRVSHYSAGATIAVKATVTLQDRNGTPANTLKVDAANEGTWGNALRIEIAASAAYPSTGFNLLVKDTAGTVLETWKDLLIGSANAANEDYVQKRINGKSAYITVTDMLSATAAPNNLPAIVASAVMASGDDGLTGLVIADYIGDAASKIGLYALDTVNVNMVAVPGESDDASGPTLNDALITYTSGRKDCIAICEVPAGKTAQVMADFRNGAGSYVHSAFNSSFAALYGPWLVASHPVTAADITLPPAGYVAGIYARTDRTTGVQAAPAGLNRGVLAGVLRPEAQLSRGERDILYEAGVNPIATVAGSLVVYGNKTLQIKASALSSVHVRRLLSYIEKAVSEASEFIVFEPHNKRTWEAFKRLVTPFLQRVQDAGGLYAFLVVCDETTNTAANIDANIMVAKVFVKPTKSAEFISVEFAIAPTGADFSEL